MSETAPQEAKVATGNVRDRGRRKITVLIPAYNEAANLELLIGELHRLRDVLMASGQTAYAYNWEFLVVDDGSSDNTPEVLRRLRAEDNSLHYLRLSRNFGKENALMAGFDYADGDCVLVMDADLQHPVDVVPQMLRCWEEGYDDVYGNRRTRGRVPLLRRKLTAAYYKMLSKSTRLNMLPNVGDFRLLDRRCVEALRAMRESQRNTKGLLCWVGFRKKGIDYDEDERHHGRSRYTYRRLFDLAFEGLTLFSTAPLRFASIMGMAVSAVAFVYLLVILCKTLIWGEVVQGYPTLMCVILFLGGCQLLAIGIIGEYVGRIFNEAKKRPPYIAESYDGEKC